MASRIHREVYVRFWREYGTVEVDDRLCLPHDLDIQVSKLKLLKANHTSQKYRMEDDIAKNYPAKIRGLQERITMHQDDIQRYEAAKDPESFSMEIMNQVYDDRKEAGEALITLCREKKFGPVPTVIGEYAGFQMGIHYDLWDKRFKMILKGSGSHQLELGMDPLGNIKRISNALEGMEKEKEELLNKLQETERQMEIAKKEVLKPFPKEEELQEKMSRLAALNALLNMDEKADGNEEGEVQETAEVIPIKEVIEAGKQIDGITTGRIGAFEDAIKEFETLNKVENPVSPNLKDMDRDEIVKRYNEYLAISHRQELKEYVPLFSNASNSVNAYLAQIYHAKANGLSEAQIDFLIKQTNEKALDPEELSQIRISLESGFTMQEAEKLIGKDFLVQCFINSEIKMDCLSPGQRDIILESSNLGQLFVCQDLFHQAENTENPDCYDEVARSIVKVTGDIENKEYFTKNLPFQLKDYVLNEFKLSGAEILSIGEEMLKCEKAMSNEELEQFITRNRAVEQGLTPLPEMNLLEEQFECLEGLER